MKAHFTRQDIVEGEDLGVLIPRTALLIPSPLVWLRNLLEVQCCSIFCLEKVIGSPYLERCLLHPLALRSGPYCRATLVSWH